MKRSRTTHRALPLALALAFPIALIAPGCGENREPLDHPSIVDHRMEDDPAEDERAGADGVAEARPDRPSPAPQAPPAQANPGGDPEAPAQFTVRLDTTAGEILVDVHRDWAPHGADRFHRLVTEGFFTDVAFFRVIEGFMAQGGVHGDPSVASQWRERRIPDDPSGVQHNDAGYLSFAMAGPGTRTTQFFINLVDNRRLDSMGFAPFGQVRDMAPVRQIHSGYGESAPRGRGPTQGRLQAEGNAYLRAEFPELTYIRSASIVPQ